MYIGIDPGLSGAIAFLNKSSLFIYDMPIQKVRSKKKIDAAKLAEILKSYKTKNALAVVELVGPMPNQGVVSTFNFGYGAGIIEGILRALLVKTVFIRPNVWKPAMGLSSKKVQSLGLARNVFPKQFHYFKRQKDDGRAEASLMAYFARKNMGHILD